MLGQKKKYYYECVYPVELNYLAPDHRKERWEGLRAPIVLHPIRFYPEDTLADKAADYLLTTRLLAKHLTMAVTRMVRRKNLRTGEYTQEPTESRVKFRLVESEDMTEGIKKKARELDLPETAYLQEKEEVDAIPQR